jgi:DMSO/TMAO reductase YedYZ molybdopterin-dependent catalytic subunit
MRVKTLGRRELVVSAVSLVGCSVERPREGFLGAMDGFNERAQALLFDPAHLARTEPISELTADDHFPAYKIGAEYPAPPASFSLEVGGAVERPRHFSLEELERLPRSDLRVRHHCVEGWSAVASWHGVRLKTLLDVVGLRPHAPFVECVSFEPTPESTLGGTGTYTSSWDLESALHPQTLLAYGMNGNPLGRLHGGPLRLYSATKLGYKMVKWLRAIRILPRATGGYWENQGYEWFAGV